MTTRLRTMNPTRLRKEWNTAASTPMVANVRVRGKKVLGLTGELVGEVQSPQIRKDLAGVFVHCARNGISRRSMNRIFYKETLRSIFHANTEIESLEMYASQLWVAVVTIVYHFEDAAFRDSKLKEVRSSHHTIVFDILTNRLSPSSPISTRC